MNNFEPEGIFPAIPTAISEDGSINYEAQKEHIDYLEENNVQGLVPAGCTGHAAALGDQGEDMYGEHVEFISEVADYTDLPVLAGTGMNTPQQAIELGQRVENQANIDAHMMISGYVNCPPPDQIVEHYREVAENVEEDIIAYNVPGRTGTNIDVDAATQLAEIDGLIGLKEASEDPGQVYNIARELESQGHSDFALFSGLDALNHFFYDVGGHGAISVSANLAPQKSVNVWEEGFVNKNTQESYEMNQDLQGLHSAMFQEGEKNPISVQYGMNLMGFDFGNPRPPLDRPPRQDEEFQNRAEIEEVMSDLDII